MKDGISIGTVENVNPSKRTLRLRIIKSYGINLPNLEWLKGTLKGGEPFRYRVAHVEGAESDWTLTLVQGVPRNTCAELKKAARKSLPSKSGAINPNNLKQLKKVLDSQAPQPKKKK